MSKDQDTPQAKREYLGDGAYAYFDGWQVCVEADRDGMKHWVALDPPAMQALLRYARMFYGDGFGRH